MNKMSIVEAVQGVLGGTKVQAEQVVDMVFDTIVKGLKKGDEVKMEGPFGNFIIGDNKEPVFIAGGVGITPFMSMLKDNSENKIKRKITLIYASKTEKDIIFKKDIDSIKGVWLKIIYVLSEEDTHGKYEFGRINKEILVKYVGNFEGKKFYICGPEGMKNAVSQTLKELGIKKENIKFEDFFW